MYVFKYLALTLLLAITFSETFAQKTMLKTIEYDVQIIDTYNQPDAKFKNNIEREARLEWLTKLFTSAENGDLSIYTSSDLTNKAGTEVVTNYLYQVDTTYIINPITYNEIMEVCKTYMGYGGIEFIRFREEWFQLPSGTIEKKVVAIAPIISIRNPDTKILYRKALFWVANGQYTVFQMPITTTIEYTVELKSPKDNKGEQTLEHQALLTWMDAIEIIVKKDYSKVYVQGYPAINLDSITTLAFDTFPGMAQNPIPDYLAGLLDVDVKLLVGIAFREEWSWHATQGFTKKVIALAPMVEVKDNQGKVVDTTPLFWLKP